MKIVLPGELLVDKAQMDIENGYVEDEKTYSSTFGLYYDEKKKVQQFEGPFLPREGDEVIGVVSEPRHNLCVVDINSPYTAMLFDKSRGRGTQFLPGQVILAKIARVDEIRNIELEEPRVLKGGEIIEIPAAKVPRVLGKMASMLTMLKEMTQCEIIVGVNGRIWIDGEKSSLAVYAIMKIEKEAHIPGLTERIKKFLEDELKR